MSDFWAGVIAGVVLAAGFAAVAFAAFAFWLSRINERSVSPD